MNVIYKIPVFPRHLILFAVSIIFQLFFFDYLKFSEFAHTSFYLFFIITLPVKIKKIVLLFICFLFGATIDIFSGSGGIYTITTTFIGFIRPAILRLFFVRDDSNKKILPISQTMGGIGFSIYSSIIIFISAITFSVVESFSLYGLWDMLYQSLLTTIITLPVIYLTQILLLSHKDSR